MSPRIVPDVVVPGRPATLPPTASVVDAARRMIEEATGTVAVTDDDGRLLGTVGAIDLLRHLVDDHRSPAATPVADIMQRQPDVLTPGDRVLDALDLMLVRGASALPVVTEGRVVAVVDALDLARAIRAQTDTLLRARHTDVFGIDLGT